MRKIIIVANREYLAAVRTRTFLFGLLIMPIMMGASALLQYLLRDAVDVADKKFVVVDRTPKEKEETWAHFLKKQAEEVYNPEQFDPQTGEKIKAGFVIMPEEPAADPSQQRLELSRKVRNGDLDGFLEILSPDPDDPPMEVVLRFQSNRATIVDFPLWAEKTITERLRTELAAAAKLTDEQRQKLIKPARLDQKGLATQDAQGLIEDDSETSRYGSLVVPTVLLVLMFMLVLMGSTPLMQGVVEEKMQRIAEVLLGSLRPFELMMGKLLGMTAVSLTIGAVYLVGAWWAAGQFGFAESLTPGIILWFIFFLILSSLMYGSLFIAVGAACTEMKETQSMVLPVMLLACLPMFVLGTVLREPNGPVIRAMTFFPFATPALMLARIAILPNLPWWEPVLGAAIVLATTLLCVWISGRIFRIGILLQGKGANFGQILRWIIKG